MAELIGLGDLHFDGHLAKYIDDLPGFIENEVNKVLRYARKNGAQNIIFYGDLCERPLMSYASMRSLFRILSTPKFQFHIILGNHDIDTRLGGTPDQHSLLVLQDFFKGSKTVHIYTEPTDVEIDGVLVRFLPWPHLNTSPDALNIAHIEVLGAKWDSGRDTDSKSPKPNKKHVVVLGHIHTAQKIYKHHFSGTLYQTNFGEKLPKYFHHIEFNSPDDYDIRLIKHRPDIELRTIKAMSEKDLEQIPTDKNILVRLVLDGISVESSNLPTNVVAIKSLSPGQTIELLDDIEFELENNSYQGVNHRRYLRSYLKKNLEEGDGKLRRQVLREFETLFGQ